MNEIEKPLRSANMYDVVQEWYAKFVEVRMALFAPCKLYLCNR